MERIVLVHGSVFGGRATWAGQEPLRDRFELIVVERPGFPPGPPVERVDFEPDAALVASRLEPGDHLLGHSYGGVVTLLAAALAPARLGSLAVVEPPCTRVAAGSPAADAFAAAGARWWAEGPPDPEAFLRGFLRTVGSAFEPPSPLPPPLMQGAQALRRERGPWEADIPLDALEELRTPALVVSGAHHPGFDAICDVLERRLHAERLVLPGFGHAAQRHPSFNEAYADFVARAAAA